MADLASVKLKLTDTDVQPDAPVSEALNAKIGENINYLIDTTDTNTTSLATKATLTLVDTSPVLSGGAFMLLADGTTGTNVQIQLQIGASLAWSTEQPAGVYTFARDKASSTYKIYRLA